MKTFITIGSVLATFSLTAQDAVIVTTVAGSGETGSLNHSVTQASFNRPFGLTITPSGDVYVADENNHQIRKVVQNGGVTTFAGSSSGYVEGTGTAAKFNEPSGIVINPSGTAFYVTDRSNDCIRKITMAGVVTTIAGFGQGDNDGQGNAASLSAPTAIAVNASGVMYIADQANCKIKKVTQSGVVTTIAGAGDPGYVNGSGPTAKFYMPRGIAVDAAGNIYVADTYNNRIRKVTPSGNVSTLAGSGDPGFANGTGTAAQFFYPSGIAVDGSGNVFVADMFNNQIRKITPAGVVTTYAGSIYDGDDDGDGTTARFDEPTGLSIDANGVLYVADNFNNKIRKITPVGVAGIDNQATENQLNIYPNPAQNVVNVQMDNKATLMLTDASGRVLLTKTLGGKGVINVSGLSAGLYYLKNNSTGETKKVIISK